MAVRLARAWPASLVGWAGPSTPPPGRGEPPRRLLAPALAGAALAAAFLLATLAQGGFSVTVPFAVGERFGLGGELAARGVPVAVQPGVGYDGQWYLAMATDPLLRGGIAARFDDPRYRAGRPLQAWAGFLLALGRPRLLPAALLAVGLLAVATGVAATARVASAFGRSRWWGLAFALVPGVAVGVGSATAEPLALALAAAGLALVLARRLGLAGLAFAAAALTKETYLAFAVAAALHLLLEPEPASRRLRRAAVVLLPGAIALAAWWAYLVGRVPAVPGRVGAVGAVVAFPLSGWLRWFGAVLSGHYARPFVPDAPGPAGAAFQLATLALVAAGLVAGLRGRGLPARAGLVLGCYALVLGDALTWLFYSAMRVLAPCVLAALLAVLAWPTAEDPLQGRAVTPGPVRRWPRAGR
ncbi:MAG TPA: hypothetical protein VF486_12790 [Actinomycetes bacterium]